MMVWKKGNSLETWQFLVHSGKLTYQCKMDPLKMYFLLKWGYSIAMLVYQRVSMLDFWGVILVVTIARRGFASQYHTWKILILIQELVGCSLITRPYRKNTTRECQSHRIHGRIVYLPIHENHKNQLFMYLVIQFVTFLGWWVHVTLSRG